MKHYQRPLIVLIALMTISTAVFYTIDKIERRNLRESFVADINQRAVAIDWQVRSDFATLKFSSIF